MKKILLLLAAVTLSAGLYSCKDKKDTTVVTTDPGTVTDPNKALDKFYDLQATPTKKVTLDAAVGGSFYGTSGTRYVFPANCFAALDGSTVTGNVDIEVAEYLKRGDMIFSKVLPISDNEPLVSAGEVYVSASQNGQRLVLRNNFTYNANIPQYGGDNADMKVFLGAANDNPANKVNWKPFIKDSVAGPAGLIYNGDTITVFTDSIGYCNADRFLSNPNYQQFTVKLSGVTLGATPAVRSYALYDNFKGAWQMAAINSGSISENHVPDIPVHFVIIAVVNDEFYGGILGATPQSGQTYTVPMTKVDPATFKAQINGL